MSIGKSATRKLLVTDLVILNHGQVTMTPDLASLSPNFPIPPTVGCLSFDTFNVHRRTDLTAGLQRYWLELGTKMFHESVALTTRLPQPQA
ncbi:hypothetical protein TNCV_2556411 [Trichonephila clavipes]|nr:hypothetical protein TNCV_2556411 [Trichonephila clavipes]